MRINKLIVFIMCLYAGLSTSISAVTPMLEHNKVEALNAERASQPQQPVSLWQKYKTELYTLLISIPLVLAFYSAPTLEYRQRRKFPTDFMPTFPRKPARPEEPLEVPEFEEEYKEPPLEPEHGLINKTRLFKAADAGHLKTIRHYIEDLNVNPNIKRSNDLREPLLSVAAKEDNIELAKYLLSRPGIEVNARDKRNNTPLMYAVINGSERMVRELLRHMDLSTINYTNDVGMTAMMYADKYGYNHIAELLVSKGAYMGRKYRPQPMISAPTLSPQQKELIENARPYADFGQAELKRARRHAESLQPKHKVYSTK